MDASPSPAASLPVRLAAAVLPVLAVALLAPVATRPSIPGWYGALAKPPFTPPNGLFAPVWGVLFAAMAYAAFRILSGPGDAPRRRMALFAFLVQLALNALWSWIFFAARSPGAAALVILALLAAIGVTIALFRRLDRTAATLLVPYLAWVGYATYLNVGIWRLNG